MQPLDSHPEIAAEQALERYFARIGYSGTPRADLQTLRTLTQLQPAAIAFEAIDALLGRPIDISPRAVNAKLLEGGRGGYCFEQNGLLKRVLEALGFAVEGLIGRVLWMQPPDAPPMPLTHMALRVTLHGERWLADVGFGSCIAGAPLRFDVVGTEQSTRHENYRLTRRGAWTLVEIQLPDGWRPLYVLAPEPALDIDYVAANWYTSTHPASGFRRELRVAMTSPERRTYLMNDRLTIRHADGRFERRFLGEQEIAAALVDTFRLRLDPDCARRTAAIGASAAKQA